MTHQPHRWHDALVAGVVGSYSEPCYVEVGVASCECFNRAAALARVAHAVDPDRHALAHISPGLTQARAWHMGSTAFWKRYNGHADVVFIDGLHTYQQAKRDFNHAAEKLHPGGTILLHDVWPASAADTRTEACGNVYRLSRELMASGGGLWRTFLFGRFPGLLLVQRKADNPPWTP